jgi:hypothetical protein
MTAEVGTSLQLGVADLSLHVWHKRKSVCLAEAYQS